MLVNLVSVFLVITVGSCQECKSCKKEIEEVFEMAKSVMAGFDPMVMEDVEVCKFLTVGGLKTIKTGGTPCIKDLGSGDFNQEIEIGFEELHINCTLKSLDAMAKIVGVPLPKIPKIKLPSFGGTPKEDKPDFIMADWVPISLDMKMKLNFDKDIFDVLKSEVKGVEIGALKIYCKGEGIIMTSCELLTKPEATQNLLGLMVQYSIKKAINTVLKKDSLKEMITMINCGDPN